MAKRIVLLPGDGIGPEIMAAAARAARRASATSSSTSSSSAARRSTRTARRSPTRCSTPAAAPTPCCSPPSAARSGTPPTRTAPRPEQGLLGLRKGLGLFANLRPVRPSPALLDASPLKRERIEGTDLLVVRELTGGIYFGDRGLDGDTAHDTCVYTVGEIERIARVGVPARAQEGDERGQGERPRDVAAVAQDRRARGARSQDIPLEHMLVDNAAMQLVSRPAEFDVILTENMFGDILSDEAAMLTGSLGMLPSASLGDGSGPGLFEPVHGSAPDIAGTGHGQPAGDVRLGGADAAPRTGYGRRRPLP